MRMREIKTLALRRKYSQMALIFRVRFVTVTGGMLAAPVTKKLRNDAECSLAI